MAGDMEDAVMAPCKRVYMYNPLTSFSSHIDDYVAESLRREGRGDAISQPYCGGTRCVNIPVKVDPDLPDAWEDTLFVGMDANFKLERFEVSSEENDPGPGSGLGYFVDTTSFKNHLKMFDKHIVQARSTSSGVGGVVCMHHELKLALSTVDLRVGETQVEMDYGYLTTVRRFNGVPHIVTSYNIACQWSINLEDCIKIYGLDMAPLLCHKLYLVPKFHLPGHIKNCQEKFCMSFHSHVGNNDGEAPEQSWAISNGVAASTQEMSPGHRHEKLDQHFRDINWQKNISMGDLLLRKIKEAVPNAAEYKSHFKCFTKTLPSEEIAKWTAMVEAREVDREEPNPFARTVAKAAMHLQLAHEDAQDELVGLNGDQLFVMSPKDMVAQGVQIEASQRRIARINKELGQHSTDLQQAQVLEKSNCLHRKIESWFIQQEAHMPVVHGLQVHDSLGDGPLVPAYSQQLYLPSSILLMDHPCGDILIRAEARLCIGQGFDLLHTIHGHLLALAKAYKDGDTTTLTQKEWLKCYTTRDINACITQAKNYY
ncbi:hypothetical protein EDD18DRAFT_1350738 [Armillaria luteobubalina]|uniref:CxC2-like cysteine cluster KDZ transposase-associated domain-containing protein n=1 Tax=Armillaria luteobubalina TaxID=153913 RepID=A0AA39TR13_9AGAR|nr:hypothetical protein EDD18DRAFT_1350738 [Armillaria luteobubalina]